MTLRSTGIDEPLQPAEVQRENFEEAADRQRRQRLKSTVPRHQPGATVGLLSRHDSR